VKGFEQRTLPGADGVSINAVVGGSGPPLLLLHGYPQTHVMWHKVAPVLARRFTVVATDLRGYGDSGKPPTDADHAPYSKRAMGADQLAVMRSLGFDCFFLAGHDRGGRVAHRLALDHPDAISRLAVLDIAPTREMYRGTTMSFAYAYYHWFFLTQPYDLPERLIGADPEYYIRRKLTGWSAGGDVSRIFTPEALEEYIRCFNDPDVVHASCEDYRASIAIDIAHDDADGGRKLEPPLLCLWGARGVVERLFDVLALWRSRAETVTGAALSSGHYLAEEVPAETADALVAFFGDQLP